MNIKNINMKGLLFILISLLTSASLFAQGWERIYQGNPNSPQGYSVAFGYEVFIQENGGYLVYCDFDGERRFMETDENGYQTNATVLTTYGPLVTQDTNDDNFVFARRLNSLPEEDIALTKVDANGTVLWEHHFGDIFYLEAVSAMLQSTDGNYVFGGAKGFLGSSNYIAHVYKVNENGDVLWNTSYDHDHDIYNFSLAETADGGYLMSGSTEFSTTNQPYKSVLIKLSSSGFVEWTGELNSLLKITKILIDGDEFLFWGRGGQPNWTTQLIKTDENGNELWTKEWAVGDATDLIKTTDGGYALLHNPGYSSVGLVKTDSDGNTQWEKEYGGIYNDRGYDVKQTPDGGYIITGSANGFDEDVSLYLIKTDENGEALTNTIEGYVQYDINENCINDLGEQALEDWIVTLEGNATMFYGSVDENGYYAIDADTGTYDIRIHAPNVYWEPCVEVEMVQLDMNFDTIQVDFAVQSVEQCPLMEVTMNSFGLRICEEGQIVVNCKNQGTWIAEDVYVEITFDDSLEVLDASVIYNLISGNTYSFDVGDIDFLQEENFTVDVQVGCAEELIGQALCSEALIFPDSSCLPIDSLWSGASIEATAWCEGGEVKLQLKNIGTAAMQQELEYIVVEDDVIMNVGEPYGPLAAGDSILITEDGDGTFYRIESPQVPNHPGMSMPSAFVEACGEGDNGEISLGFVNQYPLNDADPFTDILCQEVLAAIDPNVKAGFPIGYDVPHFIERNTDIEYVIHFQNTGTAPANLVVIQDVISEQLDPSTIRPGVSSHPYGFELFSDGIVKFTFENIMLPDSTTNEAASHGFVQFKISQKENLPLGTEIRNEAAIFFDFNAPIITNQTLHTIGENFITVEVGEVMRPDISVNVYPNPFDVATTFELKGENLGSVHLQLFDAMGRMVKTEQFSGMTYQFYRKGLAAGIYFYNITDKGSILNSGRIIIQ